MECLVTQVLIKAKEKGKSLLVIIRYLHMKHHIWVTEEALKYRLSFLKFDL